MNIDLNILTRKTITSDRFSSRCPIARIYPYPNTQLRPFLSRLGGALPHRFRFVVLSKRARTCLRYDVGYDVAM
ncbi:MAG: hypothetical protein HC869_16350 [Rhodospirillales bacterium]|nr:hypothetical protein [Rhodospirillales bacterium]